MLRGHPQHLLHTVAFTPSVSDHLHSKRFIKSLVGARCYVWGLGTVVDKTNSAPVLLELKDTYPGSYDTEWLDP